MKDIQAPNEADLEEVPRAKGTTTMIDPVKTEVANPDKKSAINYWNWIRNIASLGALLLIVYGFYITFDSTKIVEITNEPLPVTDDIVKPGEPIILHVEYNKFTDDVADVVPMLICENNTYFLPGYISSVEVGKDNGDFTIGYVPLAAKPDICFVRLIIRYQTNVLHREHITVESQPLEIISGPVIYLP